MAHGLVKWFFGLCVCLLSMTVSAKVPLWTFTPLTPTTVSVASNESTFVVYRVTNTSISSFTLIMNPIRGITQVVIQGKTCDAQFTLAPNQSCLLALSINGSLIPGALSGGPVVCNRGNPAQCYRPALVNNLNITVSAGQFTLGGTATGAFAGLVLQNNGADNLTVNASPFQFSQPLPAGNSYYVTVKTQPPGQTCTVSNGVGTNIQANVTNVSVSCVPTTYTIGGTVSGVTFNGLVLQNNGANNLSIPLGATSFTFPTPVLEGSNYNVTVLSPAPGGPITCTVNNGQGTNIQANVTNISVTCNPTTYTIGGTISGLSANGLTLLNNGGDPLSVLSGAVSFTFSKPVAAGSSYHVTINTNPTGLVCTILNGSGDGGPVNANVNSVDISCAPISYTIGGTITGLISNGLQLQLQGSTEILQPAANSTTFQFTTQVVQGGSYQVLILQQPAGLICKITANGSGTNVNANVNNVAINCGYLGYTSNSRGGSAEPLSGCLILPPSASLGLCQPAISQVQPFSDNLTDISFNPSGTQAYVSDPIANIVYLCAVDPVTRLISSCVNSLSDISQFQYPTQLAFYTPTQAYVVNSKVSTCIVNQSTGTLSGCVNANLSPVGFSDPVHVTVTNPYVFVLEGYRTIWRCPVTRPQPYFNSCQPYDLETLLNTNRVNPTDLEFSGSSTLYGYIVTNDTVYVCNATNYNLSSCQNAVNLPVGFTRPNSITFDVDGNYAYIASFEETSILLCQVNQSTGLLSNCVDATNNTYSFPLPNTLTLQPSF